MADPVSIWVEAFLTLRDRGRPPLAALYERIYGSGEGMQIHVYESFERPIEAWHEGYIRAALLTAARLRHASIVHIPFYSQGFSDLAGVQGRLQSDFEWTTFQPWKFEFKEENAPFLRVSLFTATEFSQLNALIKGAVKRTIV